MATKEISQLPSTNVSNDTDLLMTRQGSQDRAVQVQTVRNIGTEPGQSLGVGGYGIGGNAISITSLYASNNANLIDRSGVYAVAGATNVPVAVGELKHWQTSATEATQEVIGQNQEAYFRKKVAGTWLAWVLYGAADKATVRTDLDVYSKSEGDGRYLEIDSSLQEISDAGSAARAEARDNIGLNSDVEVFSGSTSSFDMTSISALQGWYLVEYEESDLFSSDWGLFFYRPGLRTYNTLSTSISGSVINTWQAVVSPSGALVVERNATGGSPTNVNITKIRRVNN